MTAQPLPSSHQDPQFGAALQHFQKGEWEPGLAAVEALEKKYPLEPELRRLRQEMQIRAGIDEDERHDRTWTRARRLRTLVTRLGVLAALLVLALFAYRQYSTWVGARLAEARVKAEVQMLQLELASKFQEAQIDVKAGKPEAALLLVDEIAKTAPEYPRLADLRAEAVGLLDLETQYQEAKRLYEAGDFESALPILAGIAAKKNYRDVSQMIDRIENQFLLGELLAQADGEAAAGKWEEAISGYETVRSMDAGFEAGHVREQLYQACLNAAQERLANEPDSLAALQAAQGYFNCAKTEKPLDVLANQKEAEARRTIEERLVKSYMEQAQAVLAGSQGDSLEALDEALGYLEVASRIHPDDPEIKTQMDVAKAYMASQADFGRGQWFDVVASLELVYGEDPNYALGTARHTLYEAYLQLGDMEEAGGNLESALTYFQKAAGLAQQDPSSPLRLYEVQVRVARVYGALGQYEEGIPLYRTAIELGGQADQAETDESLGARLDQAERSAANGSFRTAYRTFREIVEKYPPQVEEKTVTVQAGQTINSILNRYKTTLEEFMKFNPNFNPKNPKPGDQVIIPTLPGGSGQP